MTRVDVHPEELLDGARRGELDAAERRRLDAHLAHCVACRVEHEVMADFDRELTPRAADDEAVARIAAGALAGAGMGAGRAAPRAKPATGRRRVATVAAAGLVVGLFGGAAAAFFALSPTPDAPPPPTPDQAPTPTTCIGDTPQCNSEREREATTCIGDRSQCNSEAEPGVDTCIGDRSQCNSEREESGADEQATAEVVEPRRVAEAPAPSAEELLARANEARRAGQYQAATRLYRTLQRTYPASREAAVSRVTLGRLLLDGAGEPAGALREFEAYLARSPSGVLAEEARVGRALALGRLGRAVEEQDAWRDLLTHHPDSLHAERARQRLR